MGGPLGSGKGGPAPSPNFLTDNQITDIVAFRCMHCLRVFIDKKNFDNHVKTHKESK